MFKKIPGHTIGNVFLSNMVRVGTKKIRVILGGGH